MTDPYRRLARAGLSPLVEGLPEAPAWDELGAVRPRVGAAAVPRRRRPWTAGAIVAAIVAILWVTSLLFLGDPDTIGPGDAPFDVESAAAAAEAWWAAVIGGDIAEAGRIAHPQAGFSYPGLEELIASMGDVIGVLVSRDPFGGPPQWQLCFMVAGARATYAGSMVYREDDGVWLPWEQRSGTGGCGDGEPGATTTMPPAARNPVVSALRLDEPIPLRILAVRPNNPSLAVLDLESATMTVYPPRAHPLPLDALDGAVMTPLRHIIIWTQGIARLFTGPLHTVDLELRPDPLREIPGFSPSILVVPTPDGRRAWLVQPGITYGDNDYPTVAELVEVATGRRLRRFEIDGSAFPSAATDTGLVLNSARLFDTGDGWTDEPGSHRVLLLSETGDLRVIGQGSAIAASSNQVVMQNCARDRRGYECQLRISNPDGTNELSVSKAFDQEAWVEVGGPGIPSDAMPLATISPDGSRLLIALGEQLDGNRTPARSALVAVDMATGEVRVIREFDRSPGLATWSADGRWIAALWFRDVLLIDATDPGRTILLEDVIPPDHFVLAAG